MSAYGAIGVSEILLANAVITFYDYIFAAKLSNYSENTNNYSNISRWTTTKS
jgi:hypothetical protein